MKVLLDENAEYRLASFLQQAGYDATAIGHDYPRGLSDREVLALAYKEHRILLTNDRSDFGELIFRYHIPHCGVILFRLKIGDIETKHLRLQQVLSEYSGQLHHFLVITAKRVRVRKTFQQAAA